VIYWNTYCWRERGRMIDRIDCVGFVGLHREGGFMLRIGMGLGLDFYFLSISLFLGLLSELFSEHFFTHFNTAFGVVFYILISDIPEKTT
jgi:hypothetical protein